MMNYEKLYYDLFNAITDALGYLERGDVADASIRLASAQYFAEEAYINMEESVETQEESQVF